MKSLVQYILLLPLLALLTACPSDDDPAEENQELIELELPYDSISLINEGENFNLRIFGVFLTEEELFQSNKGLFAGVRTTRVLQNTDYEEINNDLPEWYSSDESVVTIQNGQLSAVSNGTAMISGSFRTITSNEVVVQVDFEESEPDDPTDDPIDPDDPDPIDSSFEPDTTTLDGKWKAKANNYKIIFNVERNADSVNYDVIGTLTLTVVSFNLIDREIPFEGIIDSAGVMDVDISDTFSVNTFLGSDQVNTSGDLDGLFLLEGTADGTLNLDFSSEILGTAEKQWNWTAVKIEN